MLKICIAHNQINYGRGWKEESEDVCDIAKRAMANIAISYCPKCIKAEENKRQLTKTNDVFDGVGLS